ncbi:hypothetical protein [Phycisphaera mikurensis]|uniref:Uncharacterized protein n=1 Tax=Phycisphaera mikurensis (strain NBRC 102666 / KCTC 22515 / FYK2301M01) TaxID=1142394 RepID=I0IFZ9_PHYMF|nr:hypothetical protein [Phycisphaera mikurensis]MBB6440427.1 hypothetical protein [Phycisphaera mikurensis]BAM04187.1 hypothetical protein PSMK_20280 [Phycisphaera mikurensis NBRC 102666]
MNPSFTPTASRTPRARTAGRRGSALLLAVIIVVLMTMMGAAYLQVARTDRRTSVDVDTRADVDNSSILRYIALELAGDVPVEVGATEPEPYDFPWTRSVAPASLPANDRWVVLDRFAPTTVPGPQPDFNSENNNQPARPPRADGNLNDAAGNLYAVSGPGDDTWLASTEPVFTGPNAGSWPHLTNLMGIYLDLQPGSLITDADGNIYPRQYLSTADDLNNSGDTGVDLGFMQTDLLAATGVNKGSRFADADGDGIADSRWTWAPLPSDGGLAYVMAVRIVDNSALVNLNAWTSPGLPNTDDGARWNWPGELSLELSTDALIARAGGGAGPHGFDGQVLTDGTARDMAGSNREQRYENWLTTTSTRGGNPGNLGDYETIGPYLEREATPAVAGGPENLGPITGDDESLPVRVEEVELRWKNGLDRSDDGIVPNAGTPLEDLRTALFRAGKPAAEADYADSGYTSLQAFFENEPRKQMTVVSGSSNAARRNLNTADLGEIASAFTGPLSYGGGTPRKPALFDAAGWEDYFASGDANADFNDAAEAFGNQFAALVEDFKDDDSHFTLVNNAYGMERVPVISEVWSQARYQATDVTADPGPPAEDLVDWTYQDHAVVIELVNPWPVPTVVTGVELVVGDESWGELDALLAKDVMDGHEIAVIRRPDALAGAAGPAQAPITAAGVDSDHAKTPAPDDFRISPAGPLEAFDITLVAEDNDGNEVPYQRLAVLSFPEEVLDERFATGGVTLGETRYRFARRVGTANGLNALAARSVDFSTEVPTPVPTGTVPPTNTVFVPAGNAPGDQFGTASKSVTSGATDVSGPLADLDNRVADVPDLDTAAAPGQEPWTIGDVGRLTRTGDILRLVFVGPRPTTGDVEPIAEAWIRSRLAAGSSSTALQLADRMIDLAGTEFVAAGADAPDSINFAASWLQRFTTDVPARTSLVPGRINLNTAPERVIASALPMPGAAERDAIAARVVAARENPSVLGATTNRSGRIGLSATGELAGDAGVFLNATTNNAQLADFNEAELEPLAGAWQNAGLDRGDPADDGYLQDREERDRLMNYLNQVASTRSDIFTAYVLVRAYPVADFSAAPVDEYRLLAVFDRSTVSGSNPLARLLGVVKLDDD